MLSDRLPLLATAVGPMSLRSKPAHLHLQGRSIYDPLRPTNVYGRQNCVRALARGPLIPYHGTPQVEFEFPRAILAGIPASRSRPPQEVPLKV